MVERSSSGLDDESIFLVVGNVMFESMRSLALVLLSMLSSAAAAGRFLAFPHCCARLVVARISSCVDGQTLVY